MNIINIFSRFLIMKNSKQTFKNTSINNNLTYHDNHYNNIRIHIMLNTIL